MAKIPGLKPPALDPATLKPRVGSGYPLPFQAAVARREKRALGDALGLTQYGVNLVRLPPGVASAQRHWHTKEEEFVYILEGEVELVSDSGSQTLGPGMAAGFPAGKPDGHQLVNRSVRDVLYLEVGDRRPGDEVEYPGLDLRVAVLEGKDTFVHTDGRPWGPEEK
jgi:uncharacterized cupin superfamily protein